MIRARRRDADVAELLAAVDQYRRLACMTDAEVERLAPFTGEQRFVVEQRLRSVRVQSLAQ